MNAKLTTLLREIRMACAVATSMDDVNINAVIEEINSLAEAGEACLGKIEGN